MNYFLIVFSMMATLSLQAFASIPNLECEPLDQSFNGECAGETSKSELLLKVSDSSKYPAYKKISFTYDIDAKPKCYQANPVRGKIDGRAYFGDKSKAFVYFSQEAQDKFALETSSNSGETWESVVLTGRKSSQLISIKVLNNMNAEVELRSYFGVRLEGNGDVVPSEELRLRRKLTCKITN